MKTFFDDFAGNFVQAEMKKREADRMLDRLYQSMRASACTLEGRFSALEKSGEMEDLVFLAFYAGRASAVADVIHREFNDSSWDDVKKAAWEKVRAGMDRLERLERLELSRDEREAVIYALEYLGESAPYILEGPMDGEDRDNLQRLIDAAGTVAPKIRMEG